MKKILSVFIVIALIVNLSALAAAATVTPVVLVAGYSSTNLFMNANSEDREQVWKLETEELVPRLISDSVSIIANSIKKQKFSLNPIAAVAGPLIAEVFEPLALDEQGNSLYNVSPYPTGVENTRYDALKKMGGEFIPEYHCMQAIAARIGDKNLYLCTLDWRQGMAACAAVLDQYLDDVREVTGSQKVNIMGISFGAGVIGTYLTLYEDAGIENVVLNVPMLDGTSIATQLLGGDELDIQYDALLKFYMELDRDESFKELLFLADAVNLNIFDSTLREIVRTYIFDIFVHFGSAWDFVTADKYEQYKAKYLHDEKYAAIIEKSDIYHYQVQGRFAQTFAGLREKGIDVFIVAGYGTDLLTGGSIDSDGVIDIRCATGATPPGPGALSCGNAGHYHISPNRTIDAASGFLPERTWFVDGLMHGQSYWDDTSTQLIMTLLMTDEIQDVHSDDRYPQFMYAMNPGNMVTGAFNASKSGYITKHDTVFTVTNLSRIYSLVLQDITCVGADIEIDVNNTVKLLPGESVDLAVHGAPPAGNTVCDINIEYMRYAEKAPLLESRCLTHSFIGDGNMAGSVLKSDADTGVMMDNAPRMVTKVITTDFVLAKLIFILERMTAILANLFK